MKAKIVAAASTLLFAILGLLLLGGGWFNIANAAADCATMQMDAHEARARGYEDVANYRLQEANVCRGKSVNIKPLVGSMSPSPSASASETPTPSATTTPTPTPTPSATTTPPTPKWEYLANREGKVAVNAFGPEKALSIEGKKLTDLSLDEAIRELNARVGTDPMLTAATGAAAGFWPHSQIDVKTKEFAANHDKWQAAKSKVLAWIGQGAPEASIGRFAAGNYGATFAIPGKVPSVRVDTIYRSGQPYLVINDKWLQLECGFQEYWQETPPANAPKMPAPSPGMGRDDQGTPIKLVDACRLVSGAWRQVQGVKPLAGDKPVNALECRPPKGGGSNPTTPTERPTQPVATATTVPTTTQPSTSVPPSSVPPTSLEPKSDKPSDYKYEAGAPKASVSQPADPKPAPVATQATGGGGIKDTATQNPGSESGGQAPGAAPAPTTTRSAPAPAPGVNTPKPSASTCVPAPRKDTC